MREVTAYLCEHTETIHTTAARARRSEFHAMIKCASNCLPAGKPSNTMQDAVAQLGQLLTPPTAYPQTISRLREALDYLEAHIGEM